MPNHLKLFKTDERDETWESGAVLWRVHWAIKCLFGHSVLQERQLEGECFNMYSLSLHFKACLYFNFKIWIIGWYCFVFFFSFLVLQDIFKDSDVELDRMFKLSFAYDIVNVSQINYFCSYVMLWKTLECFFFKCTLHF